MGVPEANASGEQDSFVSGELLNHLRDGCFSKVRWRHGECAAVDKCRGVGMR